MKKIDQTVLKETKYIALFSLILSVLMQSVFLVAGAWDYTVVLGNALTYIMGVLNFFLMAYTVQMAVKKEENEAKSLMKLSSNLRLFGMFVVLLTGILVSVFNTAAVIIPVFFPRICVFIRKLFLKDDGAGDVIEK